MITDPNGWFRLRSEVLQFYATDEDISEWLQVGLPDKYAPYHLTGQDVLRLGKGKYVRRGFLFGVAASPECRRRSEDSTADRRLFFIHSEAISGPPMSSDAANFDA